MNDDEGKQLAITGERLYYGGWSDDGGLTWHDPEPITGDDVLTQQDDGVWKPVPVARNGYTFVDHRKAH